MPTGLALLSLWLLVQPHPAWAQAPFYTDDTGVADPGMLHVEASDELDALQSMQYPDLRQNTATLKTNVGLPHGLELDLDFPYIVIDRSYVTSSSRGIGDTNLGVKWRIREGSATSHSPALAASFYTEFPTGDSRQNLGSGLIDYWLNLIAQVPASERTRITGQSRHSVRWQHQHRRRRDSDHARARLHGRAVRPVRCESPPHPWRRGVRRHRGYRRPRQNAAADHAGAQYAVREGLSLYVGLIAGTYTASPRLGA